MREFTENGLERQSDCKAESKAWQDSITLPDDTEGWQDSICLPDDSISADAESGKQDLSRFDEAKQIVRLTGYLRGLTELQPAEWSKLSLEERTRVFQRIENRAADIAGRPPMKVETESLSQNTNGYMDWESKRIVVNSDLLASDSPDALRKSVKTLIHEGRHAYQMNNVENSRTEPNVEKVNNAWQANLQTGYKTAALFGYPLYYMQPIEVDARTFSEGVVSKLVS